MRTIITSLLAVLIGILCWSTPSAADTTDKYGVLNVFTDLPEAAIIVDGLTVGTESVIKLPLEIGEHYVQVKLDGELIYAEKVTILPNRSTTVVSDHFVDIITKTPSRGAIDREAARLRESRGNLAFGFLYMDEPQSAISVKWLPLKHVGVQGLFAGELPNSVKNGIVGGRILLSPGDKIFSDDVLTGYIFGGGGKFFRARTGTGDYLEFGIGVEARIAELAARLFRIKYYDPYNHRNDKSNAFIHDLVILALTQIFYTNLEVKLLSKNGQPLRTSIALGMHVYF